MSPTLAPREQLRALVRPCPVERAEGEVERLTGARSAVLFASARGAISAAVALLAPQGRVALPGYTCVAVANALISAGAEPVWVDVDARGLVRRGDWPEADLVITQDTYGFDAGVPGDRPAVRDASHRADLLWDATATVTVTSFEQSKSLSAGQGGVAVTSDPELAAELRRRRDAWSEAQSSLGHGLVTLLGALAGRASYRGSRVASEILNRTVAGVAQDRAAGQSALELHGYGVDPLLLGRPTETAAAVMVSQLARARELARGRAALVAVYDGEAGVEREAEPLARYPLEADDSRAVAVALRDAGWNSGRPWFQSPLHPAETVLEEAGYEPGTAPGAERLAGRVENLPTHPLVSTGDARALIGIALAAGARPLR